MSKLSNAALKLAKENPEFRSALMSELQETSKTADRDGNYMSRQALRQLADQANELLQMVDESTPLDDWLEAKLVRAAGMLTSAYNFMKYGDFGKR